MGKCLNVIVLSKNISLILCDNRHPLIGKALKTNCVKYSKKHDDIDFSLSAEVF